jgi:hypothetical protein
MIIKMPGGVTLECDALEWTLQQSLMGLMDDVILGKITFEQANLKLKLLIQMYRYMIQAAAGSSQTIE